MSAQTKSICNFCRLPRAEAHCELCEEPVCRACTEHLSEDTFSMLPKIPEVLSHSRYCPRCFADNVEPALATYQETVERAKEVGFWAKAYRGHVPVLKKARFSISVEGARDRDEAIMRLAYQAADQGFNGLINGELTSAKVRLNGKEKGYQTMTWACTATPVEVDNAKLEREAYREAHWRVLHHR